MNSMNIFVPRQIFVDQFTEDQFPCGSIDGAFPFFITPDNNPCRSSTLFGFGFQVITPVIASVEKAKPNYSKSFG
uniref:Uncharacterized protein n=1 Tax=Ditylenchus dipsaci TaxID=166011 RepID=A0A915D6M5_9BILA